jgi:hypothetical protein
MTKRGNEPSGVVRTGVAGEAPRSTSVSTSSVFTAGTLVRLAGRVGVAGPSSCGAPRFFTAELITARVLY